MTNDDLGNSNNSRFLTITMKDFLPSKSIERDDYDVKT
jgi:hypothetical protein